MEVHFRYTDFKLRRDEIDPFNTNDIINPLTLTHVRAELICRTRAALNPIASTASDLFTRVDTLTTFIAHTPFCTRPTLNPIAHTTSDTLARV